MVKVFPLVTGTRQVCPFIHHSPVSPSQSNQESKSNKSIQSGNEEIKLSVLEKIWFYIQKILKYLPKDYQKKTIYNKIAGCKINVQNSLVFLYINNKNLKKK